MSRIRKGYEGRFRSLLQQVGARKLDKGIQWLVTRARHAGEHQGVPLADALTQTYEALATKPQIQQLASNHVPHRFFCDAGLGGLARWLRAAGYEAFWEPGIDDDVLLQKARSTATTILTTDSMLMERRLLRDRILPA